jgi:predicted enzyme related to lactoylglutathione lyase
MANSVSWFEIIGKDGPKLRGFYGNLFDWHFHEAPGIDYGMLDAAPGGIGGGIGSGTGTGQSYVAVFVQVDDINASLQKVEELGGKTLIPRTVVPSQVIFAMFSDPEGHYVGLTEGM